MTVSYTVRNPITRNSYIEIYIEPNNNQLADDWQAALAKELVANTHLEKNYCWHGWPDSQRNLEYLCNQLNRHIDRINSHLLNYTIELQVTPQLVELENHSGINHDVMNQVHNHFELLQGTVNNLSPWYKAADPITKYSIRQLNNLCHEIENLCLSLRKKHTKPEWLRPSQITTFLNATRYQLNDTHRQGFIQNSYDRKFGHVYMHWAQIGKTLYEVFRDEDAAPLNQAMCDAITHLEYYSGEFDIEWGRDIMYGIHPWHTKQMDEFNSWLINNNLDPKDTKLSLGYLEIGRIDLQRSFGTTDVGKIWQLMNQSLDIYQISCAGQTAVYDYNWSDSDYEQKQIEMLMPGYRSHV